MFIDGYSERWSDFPNEEVPGTFSRKWATDALAERGNLYIADTVGVDDEEE